MEEDYEIIYSDIEIVNGIPYRRCYLIDSDGDFVMTDDPLYEPVDEDEATGAYDDL